MNIIQVNNVDIYGHRFNGYDMQIELNKRGINAKQMVFEKYGDNENSIQFVSKRERTFVRDICAEFEKEMSMQSLIYPFGINLFQSEDFKKADIVHYHLIHNMFMSLFTFGELLKSKKSIWTIHDPWIFSGHCIHSIGCEKWKTGCEQCEKLDLLFSLNNDKANQMWRIKKELFESNNMDIVVASKYMKRLIEQSPITGEVKRLHHIPFGINLEIFKPRASKEECKKKLKINPQDLVISFRTIDSEYKGVKYIIEALNNINIERKVTLLTFNDSGLVNRLKNKYNVVELGWIHDDNEMSNAYNASDIFLMPSTAEAFGLMAIEAMACGTPIVVFEGTALPDITFAPECGVTAKNSDAKSLQEAIETLINNENERKARGLIGRELAEKNYNVNDYFRKMINLYKEIYERKM